MTRILGDAGPALVVAVVSFPFLMLPIVKIGDKRWPIGGKADDSS